MELFENKYKEWLDRVYTPKRRKLYGKGTANISGVELNLKMPVVSSVERRQELQNVNTEASYVTNISEVLGARTSNVIQNTSIHDTAPDQTRLREKSFPQGSESCARDVKRALAQLKVRELQEVQAIKESEIELRLPEENTRGLAERERLRLRSQLMQAKIDAERAELEATFREQVGNGSVTSPAGSCRLRENVERYLTGLTSSVIPGQPFEDERVKPETGKYTLGELRVDPHELKSLSGGVIPHGVPTFSRGLR